MPSHPAPRRAAKPAVAACKANGRAPGAGAGAKGTASTGTAGAAVVKKRVGRRGNLASAANDANPTPATTAAAPAEDSNAHHAPPAPARQPQDSPPSSPSSPQYLLRSPTALDPSEVIPPAAHRKESLKNTKDTDDIIADALNSPCKGWEETSFGACVSSEAGTPQDGYVGRGRLESDAVLYQPPSPLSVPSATLDETVAMGTIDELDARRQPAPARPPDLEGLLPPAAGTHGPPPQQRRAQQNRRAIGRTNQPLQGGVGGGYFAPAAAGGIDTDMSGLTSGEGSPRGTGGRATHSTARAAAREVERQERAERRATAEDSKASSTNDAGYTYLYGSFGPGFHLDMGERDQDAAGGSSSMKRGPAKVPRVAGLTPRVGVRRRTRTTTPSPSPSRRGVSTPRQRSPWGGGGGGGASTGSRITPRPPGPKPDGVGGSGNIFNTPVPKPSAGRPTMYDDRWRFEVRTTPTPASRDSAGGDGAPRSMRGPPPAHPRSYTPAAEKVMEDVDLSTMQAMHCLQGGLPRAGQSPMITRRLVQHSASPVTSPRGGGAGDTSPMRHGNANGVAASYASPSPLARRAETAEHSVASPRGGLKDEVFWYIPARSIRGRALCHTGAGVGWQQRSANDARVAGQIAKNRSFMRSESAPAQPRRSVVDSATMRRPLASPSRRSAGGSRTASRSATPVALRRGPPLDTLSTTAIPQFARDLTPSRERGNVRRLPSYASMGTRCTSAMTIVSETSSADIAPPARLSSFTALNAKVHEPWVVRSPRRRRRRSISSSSGRVRDATASPHRQSIDGVTDLDYGLSDTGRRVLGGAGNAAGGGSPRSPERQRNPTGTTASGTYITVVNADPPEGASPRAASASASPSPLRPYCPGRANRRSVEEAGDRVRWQLPLLSVPSAEKLNYIFGIFAERAEGAGGGAVPRTPPAEVGGDPKATGLVWTIPSVQRFLKATNRASLSCEQLFAQLERGMDETLHREDVHTLYRAGNKPWGLEFNLDLDYVALKTRRVLA